MPGKRRTPDDLRSACLDEARRIVRDEGVEKLSLRTVARRLGVSHQAPYKHFASKEAVIAELVRHAFDDFARHLDALEPTGDPAGDLRAMGRAYVGYALRHPSEYRLMFSTPLPPPGTHPEMTSQARAAFELLEDALVRLQGRADGGRDAMFVWSTLHGLSTILQARTSEQLQLSGVAAEEMVAHALDRIGAALAGAQEEP